MDESLVRRLVDVGEDLRLGELLEQMQRCSIPFLLFDDPEWDKLEGDLTVALKAEYPGQIKWDEAFPTIQSEYNPDVIVPKHIKEKYVRCYILCESSR